MNTQPLPPIIDAQKNRLVRLAREYGIQGLFLIGSLARGDDHAESDADFLFVLPVRLKSLGRKQFELEAKMSQLLGRPVELLADHTVKPWWRPLIRQDMIKVFEDAA